MPDASSNAYPYLEEALPGFHRGQALVKAAADSLAVLGFVGVNQEFCRFANRLRLASCFGGLHRQGFTDDTATGSEALTQVFLTRSAFERYAYQANDRPSFRASPAHETACTGTSVPGAGSRAQAGGLLIIQNLLPVHEPNRPGR